MEEHLKPHRDDGPIALSTCRFCGGSIAYWEFYRFWSHYPKGEPEGEFHLAKPYVEADKELDDLDSFELELRKVAE